MKSAKSRGVLDVFIYQIMPNAKGDAEALAALDASSHPDPMTAAQFREQLSKPHLICYGIEARGDLVGYVVVQTHMVVVRIVDILVHKDFRRKGYGRALIDCIDERLLSEHRRVLEAVVPERDMDMALFLKAAGASTTELLRSADKSKDDSYQFRFFHPFSANPIGA